MNGVSHSSVKVEKAPAKTSAEKADDFEAIEEAVMATPRGRWFLAEYLRRRQSEEVRRLLEAVERLQHVAAGAAVAEPRVPALEGLRLVLAQAADELAHGLGEAAEPALPEAAAGRLAHLLQDMRQRAGQGDARRLLELLTDVLRDMLARLADMLGEPVPRAGKVTLVTETVATEAGPDAGTVLDSAMPGKARETAQETGTARGGEAAPAAGATPSATRERGQKRIVIHRHGRSGEIDIPLPERDGESCDKTAGDAGSGEKPGGREKPKVRIR